ncbi:hypothetical protein [Sphingobacterium sp. LRF_L2]|uniref:hypothetical protein n=1 Tax=Sphingobacterium sp. LRF_L2 TaxID=3369421 RepID=UPI003F629A22
MKSTFFILFLMWNISLVAQIKTFVFQDGLCFYKGYYNSEKYSERQLLDTYVLFNEGHYVDDGGTKEEFIARYDSAIYRIKNLDVVQSSYFRKLKQDVVTYLERTYEFKKIEKSAKDTPEDLMKAIPKNGDAFEYAQALNKGGEHLLAAYMKLVKEQMKKNAYPEILWNNYLSNMEKSNRLDLAFDYVLVYGWWNAVNRLIEHINYDGTQFDQFTKLFVNVETLDCDEP